MKGKCDCCKKHKHVKQVKLLSISLLICSVCRPKKKKGTQMTQIHCEMSDIDDYPDEYEDYLGGDEDDEYDTCSGFYHNGVFVCPAVGSEDCEFDCPNSQLIGTKEIKEVE